MHFISISRNNGFFKVDSDSLFKQENNLVLSDKMNRESESIDRQHKNH